MIPNSFHLLVMYIMLAHNKTNQLINKTGGLGAGQWYKNKIYKQNWWNIW